MDLSTETITIVATILLALAGYGAKYWHDLRLCRRSERLQLVNSRINKLYGPMFIITQTGRTLFNACLAKANAQGRQFINEDSPTSEADNSEWRIWVEEVFVPLNEQLEQVILEKAHLVVEKEMPDCLKLFCAHQAGYKALIKKWQMRDFSENMSIITFPNEITEYAERSYRKLKKEQEAMIKYLQ